MRVYRKHPHFDLRRRCHVTQAAVTVGADISIRLVHLARLKSTHSDDYGNSCSILFNRVSLRSVAGFSNMLCSPTHLDANWSLHVGNDADWDKDVHLVWT
jgi:hypothetical protein